MKFLKNLTTVSLAASAVAVATVGVAPAQAALVGPGCQSNTSSYSLATLVGGCNVQIGDKLFSDFFAVAKTLPGTVPGTMPGGTGISAIADFTFREVNNGDAGIGFDLFGLWQSTGGGIADLGLSYKVSVLPNFNKLINGAKATVTGSTSNGGTVGLVETIVSSLETKRLDVASPTNSSLASNIVLQAVKSIEVSKNIRATSNGLIANSEGHISIIRDVYTQTDAIPTPALLPGLVGMGLAAVRKRKNAQATAE